MSDEATPTPMKPANTFGKKVLQFFGALAMDYRADTDMWVMSLGRVTFWIIFSHMMYLWWNGMKDVQPGEQSAFYALLGYNGLKIGANAVKDSIATLKGGQPE